MKVGTLDPFRGYEKTIDDHLADATAVVDAFRVVKLATACVDDVRRRAQQGTTGHRGRKGDPLYGIRTLLRAGAENITDRQRARLTAAFTSHEAHVEVELAWQVATEVRAPAPRPHSHRWPGRRTPAAGSPTDQPHPRSNAWAAP